MGFKANSSKILEFDSAILSGRATGFWSPQDRDRLVLFWLYGDDDPPDDQRAVHRGYRLIVKEDGRLTLGGATNTPVSDIQFQRSILDPDLWEVLDTYKGYPCSLRVHTQRFNPDDLTSTNGATFATLDVRCWIGDALNEARQQVELLLSDGSPATVPVSDLAVNDTDIRTNGINGYPPWITVAPPENAAFLQDNLSFVDGNRLISDRTGLMPLFQNSYIITEPGRLDYDSVTQNLVQGNLMQPIPLRNQIVTVPATYSQSANCTIVASAAVPQFVDPITNQTLSNGAIRLSVYVPDRFKLGLENVPANATQGGTPPIRIDGVLFFIDRIIEAQDNSLMLDLVSDR